MPLEETLSCVLLKGLAGGCASERCRESALSALETLAEAYAEVTREQLAPGSMHIELETADGSFRRLKVRNPKFREIGRAHV